MEDLKYRVNDTVQYSTSVTVHVSYCDRMLNTMCPSGSAKNILSLYT